MDRKEYIKPFKADDDPSIVSFYKFVKTKGETTLAQLFGVDAAKFSGVSVSILDLSVRTTNCFNRARIGTIEEVLSYTVIQLMNIRNMGETSVKEILKKTYKYIADRSIGTQRTLSTSHQQDSNNDIVKDPLFRNAIEAFLVGEDYSTDSFTEEQLEYFEKCRRAADSVGAHICLKTLIDPHYAGVIRDMFFDFARLNIIKEEMTQCIANWPCSKRHLKIVPFMLAYSVKYGEKIQNILPDFDDDATIENLHDKIRNMGFDSIGIDEITELRRFVDWLDVDVSSLIKTVSESIYYSITKKGMKALEVFEYRARGETLESIGNIFGVTRERIRQIESKVHKKFWSVYGQQRYDLIMLIYALRNGDNVIYFYELTETVGNEFATILWECMRHMPSSPYYYFSKSLDAIVIKVKETEHGNEKMLLDRIESALDTLPEIVSAQTKDILLTKLADEYSVPVEILETKFADIFNQTSSFYHRAKLTVSYMCDYVLKNHFQNGFKIADDSAGNLFKQYLTDHFGERAENITLRAIDARVTIDGVLCDRGKYIHADYLNVEPSIMHRINMFIQNSHRTVLRYDEIFDAMKRVLKGTQITNQYILHGALKKYGCEYHTGKDYVKKTPNVSFTEEFETFIETNAVVSKSELLQEYPSLDDRGMNQIISRCANVLNIGSGYYSHINQYDIYPEDYDIIRNYLNYACADAPVNIRLVLQTMTEGFSEFIFRNYIDGWEKLYALLNYMFGDEFNFSRPYIAKLGSEDISNKKVILHHINDYDMIEIEDIIEICEDNAIRYHTISRLLTYIEPEYIRIDKSTMIKREMTGITEDVVNKVVNLVKSRLKINGYVVASKVKDFSDFPEIDIEWNEFVLDSIIMSSNKIDYIRMTVDSWEHPNAIYISRIYKKDSFKSFIIKIVRYKVRQGAFSSKTVMAQWLRERGLIDSHVPNYLKSSEYFYVDGSGVHCTDD